MKHLLTPRLALALALCGAVTPFAIAGCGGGNSNPTPNPTATPTPVNTAYTLTGKLDFSAVLPNTSIPTGTSITTFDTINPTGGSSQSQGIISLRTDTEAVVIDGNKGVPANAAERRFISVFLTSKEATVPGPKLMAGQKFNLGRLVSSVELADAGSKINEPIFRAQSGQIEILSLSPNSISLKLTDVRLVGSFGATGGFTLNGSVNATNLKKGEIS